MRSGELARLAGVTVRALRHYHRVGVLAEPARLGNGYREYDVHDLIRVLRIRRLASLGIPLERMPGLLDGTGEAGGLLDELDAELADRIDRLTRQRLVIARLRDHEAPLDLPPELAPFLAAFTAARASPDLARLDRDQVVLLAHLAGEEGMPHLARFYERLSDPAVVPAVTAVSEHFDRLGPDSTEQDVSDVVESFMTAFAAVIEDFAASEPALDLGGSADVFAEYVTDVLNEAQRRALEEMESRVGASGTDGAQGAPSG